MKVERMKELRIMKTTLRYLLIVIGLVSVLSLGAQTLAQQPEAKMASTSVMAPSGSALPQAATTGVYTTCDAQRSGTSKVPGRRKSEENPFGGDDVSGTDNPIEPGTPIGDAAWPLMLLALAYVSIRFVRTRKRVREADNV